MDYFHQEANAPIEQAPLDVAPPKPVASDWSPQDPAGTARVRQGEVRAERRGAIEAARAKVESGWKRPQHQTKAERLAQPKSKGDRDTGSPRERESTRSAVQRAMEKVDYASLEGVARKDDLSAPRKDRESFQARYPGAKASELFARAEKWDADFRKDPVATRERIMEIYAAVNPQAVPETKETEKGHGIRGSVRQALADQAANADLAPHMQKWGKNFPQILSQLQKFDADMIADPVGTSARIAASYGAPVTPAQERAYEQKRAAEQHRAQDSANVHKALEMIVQHNVLPGFEDEATAHAIADVLESKTFQRTGNRLEDLKRAHAVVMASRTAVKQSNAGNKSIGGAPSAGGDRAAPSAGSARAAVNRAFGK